MRSQRCARLVARLAAGGLTGVLLGAAPSFALEALSIYPAWVPKNTAPAQAVATIRGIGFTPATTVVFDAAPASVTLVDSRTISVQVPTSAVGKIARVVVSEPGGGSDDLFPFIYTDKNIYVAPTGNDASAGTSPAAPKRTVRSAIDEATAVTNLIHTTAGRFGDNQLGLPNGTVLAGGWDPTFTTRAPDLHVSEIDSALFGFGLRSFGFDAKVVVDGLTFMDGFRDGASGGSLEFVGDQVVVSNNVIVGNVTSAMGGGVYVGFTTSYGGRAAINGNVIIGNRSHAGAGGGIVVYPLYTSGNSIKVAISDNYIVGNRSMLSRGGGVALQTNSFYGYNRVELQMAGNVIMGNLAKAGAGVHLNLATHTDEVDLMADNEVIGLNKTAGDGGGLTVGGVGRLSGSVTGTTLGLNTAGAGAGAGITVGPGVVQDPDFGTKDLIVWGNQLDDSAGPVPATYSDVGSGGLPGVGNISSDPRFMTGLRGRFYLAQNDPNIPVSPAVDAGSDTAAAAGRDGLTTAPDGALESGTVDMGAHFEPAPPNSPDPIDLVRLDPPTGDTMGNDWVLLRGTGFDPGAHVHFGSAETLDTVYISSTRILARPVVHAPGFVTVTVTNPDATTDGLPSGYRFIDNTPPVWDVTVGALSGESPGDCVRSAILDWQSASDLLTPPVKYEIYRSTCTPQAGSIPCQEWFDFIPATGNRVAVTPELSYLDTAFAAGGADPSVMYIVRAIDAATPLNRELNLAKRVVTATRNVSDTTPPEAVGDSVDLPGGNLIDWAFSRGASGYRLYRQTNASAYTNPPGISPLITLTAANNDLNADGFVDTQFTDAGIPLPDQSFFYKVSAIDPCNVETKDELLPSASP